MKRKILSVIITLGLLVGVTTTAQSKEFNNIDSTQINKVLEVNKAEKSTKIGIVININTELQIRSSADKDSDVLGTLSKGDKVNIISKNGNWYEIEVDGITGFVSVDYISVELIKASGEKATEESKTQEKPVEESKVQEKPVKESSIQKESPVKESLKSTIKTVTGTGQVINVSSSLRVRQSPSTSSSVVGSLKGGDNFDILGKSDGWYKINKSGLVGFIHGDYVKVLSNTPDPVKPDPGTKIADGKVKNVSSSLRMRSDASTSASVVGTLYPSSTFEIYGEKNGWYYIKFNNVFGYVHGDYVQKVGSGETTPKPDPGTKIADGKVKNVSSSLRMRSDASTSASVVGTLYPSSTFEIYGEKSGWYYIKFNNTFGYVHGDYVQKVGSGETTPKPDPGTKIADGKVKNVSSSLRMRSDASTSASVVGTLYPSSRFEIYGEKNGWYYIKFNNVFGYVHGDYVQKVDPNDKDDTPINGSKYETALSSMKKHIGTPYVYGGSGEIITDSLISKFRAQFPGQSYDVPSQYRTGNHRAFDCSGLMQWGFRQAGVSLGRTTWDQITNGYTVSRSNVKPGDLIFYSNKSHVGMYVGNDQWIEAPRTGSPIRITSVPWSQIGQIRRVL